MTPGRSLPGNTSGRSIAPVASTTSRARTCHRRSRGVAAAGAGQVIGDALAEPDQVVREIAEGRRARQQRHVRRARERGERVREPLPARLSVDRRRRLVQQRAAELGLLVAEHDPRAGLRRGERRREARGTRADDEHVAMRVALRIAIGIGRGRRPPSPAARRIAGSYQRCQADRGHMNVL